MPNLCFISRCPPRRLKGTLLPLLPLIVLLLISASFLLQQWNSRAQFRELSNKHTVSVGRCQWPPKSIELLRDPATGAYDLTLRPCVQFGNEKITDPCAGDHYNYLLALYRGKASVHGSCLRRLVQLDTAVRMNHADPDYSLYPQMLNTPALVKAIQTGQIIETTPINDPELHVLRIPNGVCDPASTTSAYSQDLIVLIKSCANCFDQRKHARQTYMQPRLWAGFRVQFVFVVGMPATNVTQWIEFDGVRLRNPNWNGPGLLLPEHQKMRLFRESDQYQDLMLGDFSDTYYNLTLKQITTFRWISAFCRRTSAMYLFIDNDYSLIPSNVIRMVQRIPLQSRLRLNAGTFGPLRTVLRPSRNPSGRRWTVSRDEIPWSVYPQYSSGAAYVIGADLVTEAAIAMAFTRFLRFDDVYLGFVWTKLHVPVMIMDGMRHAVKDAIDCKDVVSLSTKDADRFVDWETGHIKQSATLSPSLNNKKR